MSANGYHYLDLESGKFARTDRNDLKAFFRALEASHTRKLVVHFHGGLVSREAAHESASRYSRAYTEAGAESLFFVWNSDLGTILEQNLPAIASEAVFWTVVSRVRALVCWGATNIPVAVAGAREGALRRGPILPANESAQNLRRQASQADPVIVPREMNAADHAQALEALQNDGALRTRFLEIAPPWARAPGSRGVGAARSKPTLMSPDVLEKAYPASQKNARSMVLSSFLFKRVIAAAGAVLKRYVTRTQHGLYATIVEEVLRAFYAASVGCAIWGAMKDNAVEAFSGSERSHAGSAFITELLQWWDNSKEVTLVGHSAGSIFVVELIQHLVLANSKLRANCVLLAPACSFERFAKGLTDFRKAVKALRIFDLSDELELGYWEVPYLYNASLLYLVSGILEPTVDCPLIGMQRYFSGRKPYATTQMTSVRKFLEPALNWSPTTVAPTRLCHAKRHGGFDRDPDTLKSLANIIKAGIQ